MRDDDGEGAVYRYLELPADVHAAFWAVGSKGRFLNEAIRDSYACINAHGSSKPSLERPGQRGHQHVV